jgi:hypothetical protein
MNRVARRRLHSLAALACAALLSAGQAIGFVALELPERLAAAQEIVVGAVSEVEVVVREGEPWTLVTLRLERAWRRGGNDQPEPLEVGDASITAAFWGGSIEGGASLQVAGMPTFVVGERVLWLVRSLDAGLGAATVGVTQGVFRSVGGAWRGDDGTTLGVSDDGALTLSGAPLPDEVLFDALAALGTERGAP